MRVKSVFFVPIAIAALIPAVAYPNTQDTQTTLSSPELQKESQDNLQKEIYLSLSYEKRKTIKNDVKSAMPIIKALFNSLLHTGEYKNVEIYGRAGGIEGNWTRAWPENAPKNVPLFVSDIGNWTSESANEFGFTANLCSPISKTCFTSSQQFINDGMGWKIKAVYFSNRF